MAFLHNDLQQLFAVRPQSMSLRCEGTKSAHPKCPTVHLGQQVKLHKLNAIWCNICTDARTIAHCSHNTWHTLLTKAHVQFPRLVGIAGDGTLSCLQAAPPKTLCLLPSKEEGLKLAWNIVGSPWPRMCILRSQDTHWTHHARQCSLT